MTDDHSLIEKILAGDRQAFRWFIKRHERLVGHVVGRIIKDPDDREEICQDVFLKAYQKLDTFRQESKLSTWLVTIAYRTSLNFLEKKKGETVSLTEIRELPASAETSRELEQADLRKMLEDAIMQLPLAYRAVITLFHLEEHSHEEVCQITGMALGTVKSNLFRGRKQLKEILEKQQNITSYD